MCQPKKYTLIKFSEYPKYLQEKRFKRGCIFLLSPVYITFVSVNTTAICLRHFTSSSSPAPTVATCWPKVQRSLMVTRYSDCANEGVFSLRVMDAVNVAVAVNWGRPVSNTVTGTCADHIREHIKTAPERWWNKGTRIMKSISIHVQCIYTTFHNNIPAKVTWIFPEPHWKSMGFPEISRVT